MDFYAVVAHLLALANRSTHICISMLSLAVCWTGIKLQGAQGGQSPIYFLTNTMPGGNKRKCSRCGAAVKGHRGPGGRSCKNTIYPSPNKAASVNLPFPDSGKIRGLQPIGPAAHSVVPPAFGVLPGMSALGIPHSTVPAMPGGGIQEHTISQVCGL